MVYQMLILDEMEMGYLDSGRNSWVDPDPKELKSAARHDNTDCSDYLPQTDSDG